MRRYVDNEYREILGEDEHGKKCKCKNIVEFSKKLENIVAVKYRYCPKCKAYIEGDTFNTQLDYY